MLSFDVLKIYCCVHKKNPKEIYAEVVELGLPIKWFTRGMTILQLPSLVKICVTVWSDDPRTSWQNSCLLSFLGKSRVCHAVWTHRIAFWVYAYVICQSFLMCIYTCFPCLTLACNKLQVKFGIIFCFTMLLPCRSLFQSEVFIPNRMISTMLFHVCLNPFFESTRFFDILRNPVKTHFHN